jgi:Ni,Fe-hydrogenase I cytochrome b subunit
MGFAFALPLLLLDFLRFRSGNWDNSTMAPYIVLSHFSLLLLFFPALLARKYFFTLEIDYKRTVTIQRHVQIPWPEHFGWIVTKDRCIFVA